MIHIVFLCDFTVAMHTRIRVNPTSTFECLCIPNGDLPAKFGIVGSRKRELKHRKVKDEFDIFETDTHITKLKTARKPITGEDSKVGWTKQVNLVVVNQQFFVDLTADHSRYSAMLDTSEHTEFAAAEKCEVYREWFGMAEYKHGFRKEWFLQKLLSFKYGADSIVVFDKCYQELMDLGVPTWLCDMSKMRKKKQSKSKHSLWNY